MPEIIRPDGAVIAYDVAGDGPALLAIAPGGIASCAARWAAHALDLDALSRDFRVVAMDQRFAGRSRAPLSAFSWETAMEDQLAVLDAVGCASATVVGAGYGCADVLNMAYHAPARLAAGVLLEPLRASEPGDIERCFETFNETMRVARAGGIEAVIDAAERDPDFIANPAAGPWAARLNAQTAFRDTLRSLGRESYIALVVNCRDGFFPWDARYFAVNDVGVSRISRPLLVVSTAGDGAVAGDIVTRCRRASAGTDGSAAEIREFAARVG